MPIGDLLASITGSQPSAANSPAPTNRPPGPPPKRKAEDDGRGPIRKLPRDEASGRNGSSSMTRPIPSQRPYNGTSSRSENVLAKRPLDANRVTKPSVPARHIPAAARPAPSAPRAPPKKGSFAEIMARGQRAQTLMGQVGKIQHKSVDKAAPPKKKDDVPPSSKVAAGKSKVAPSESGKMPSRSGFNGTAATSAGRNGFNGTAATAAGRNGARNGAHASTSSSGYKGMGTTTKKPAPKEEPEKKVRKAVQVNSGYTGTARPIPGAATKKRHPVTPGGALLNRPPPKPKPSRHSSYRDDDDEEDEEMDDFIDYDDEEDDGGGPRYDYASDGSSDMEAGLDELDVEERQAERIARKEDIEEQRLEQGLKAAKEERKRRALLELRAKRR